jgi:iron-sulfur cluster repair protein YtfE (RIC family)
MSTNQLPGSDAARHGTGEVDLTLMITAHGAFRRDLVRLATSASRRNLRNPVQQLAIANGWATFKRQLLQHHRAEDACLWPSLRVKTAGRAAPQSVLDAMEAEHSIIDPLLAAVDQAIADDRLADGHLADVIDELTSQLTLHLGHEEADALPLIGQTLTIAEWADVMGAIRARGGVADAIEMFPWLLDGLSPEAARAVLASLPPAAAQLYDAEWKPAYRAVPRW